MNGAPNPAARTGPGTCDEVWWAVMAFAWHGWAVLPGTYRDGAGRWRGRLGAVGLQPVHEPWAVPGPPGLAPVARWWTEEPYSVLLACGYGVDCLELPGPAGRHLLAVLRAAGLRPPAWFTPAGRLVLCVRPHPRPRPFLAWASVYSAGSWVALPPTGQHHTTASAPDFGYRWAPESAPAQVGWVLPELAAVNRVVTTTLGQRPGLEVAVGNES